MAIQQTISSTSTNKKGGSSVEDTIHTQLYYQQQNLKNQINNVKAEIVQLKGSIERHNRDFIDLGNSVVPNTGVVHTLDDYTMWILLLSYIIFAISIVFWYSHTNYYTISAILISVGGMTLVSFLLIILGIIVL